MQITDFLWEKQSSPMYLTIGIINSSILNKFSYFIINVLVFPHVPLQFKRNTPTHSNASYHIIKHVLCDSAKLVQELVAQCPKRADINSGTLWVCSNYKIYLDLPRIACGLIPSVVQLSEYSIALLPKSNAVCRTIRKLLYLKRSGLAFTIPQFQLLRNNRALDFKVVW